MVFGPRSKDHKSINWEIGMSLERLRHLPRCVPQKSFEMQGKAIEPQTKQRRPQGPECALSNSWESQEISGEAKKAKEETDKLKATIDFEAKEKRTLQTSIDAKEQERVKAERETDAAKEELQKANARFDMAIAAQGKLSNEKDALAAEKEALQEQAAAW